MEGPQNEGFNFPKTPGESMLKAFAQTGKEIAELREAIGQVTRKAEDRRKAPEADEVILEDGMEVRAPQAPQQERRILERNLQEAIALHEKMRQELGQQTNPEK